MRRTLLLLVAVVALAAGTAAAATSTVLVPPVDGEVVRGFDRPTTYGPGHRGVDLAAAPGSDVGAAADGTVTFAGAVAGTVWVTVDHGDVRTTVGPLATTAVARGDRVRRGDPMGTAARAHGLAAVHWSARVGDTYVDPLAHGRPVATLVPVPGVHRSWGPAQTPWAVVPGRVR